MTLVIPPITAVDETVREASAAQQLELTKPPGSLARLEELGNQLSAIAGTVPPPIPHKALAVVFAGDHGVQNNSVSPWPVSVSQQMAVNISQGGAGINAICNAVGADVKVYNVGLIVDLPESETLKNYRVRSATEDFTTGPAMTREEAEQAISIGLQVAAEAAAAGYGAVMTGEVGIGNTTPAAALISVFSGQAAELTTGRGAGADDEMFARKRDIVATAIAINQPDATDPIDTLAKVGGLEHAALVGLILGAAHARIPVLVDGVIGCSAAITACAIEPNVKGYLIASHFGMEPGIQAAATSMGFKPLLDLGLRLGEGTGAATAFPLVKAAAHILNDMATFASAGVSKK